MSIKFATAILVSLAALSNVQAQEKKVLKNNESPSAVPTQVQRALFNARGIPLKVKLFSPPDDPKTAEETDFSSALKYTYNSMSIYLQPALTPSIAGSAIKYRYADHTVRSLPVFKIEGNMAALAKLVNERSGAEFHIATEADGTPLILTFDLPQMTSFDTDYGFTNRTETMNALKKPVVSRQVALEIYAGDGFQGEMAVRQKFVISIVGQSGFQIEEHVIGQTRSFETARNAIETLRRATPVMSGDLAPRLGLEKFGYFN